MDQRTGFGVLLSQVVCNENLAWKEKRRFPDRDQRLAVAESQAAVSTDSEICMVSFAARGLCWLLNARLADSALSSAQPSRTRRDWWPAAGCFANERGRGGRLLFQRWLIEVGA